MPNQLHIQKNLLVYSIVNGTVAGRFVEKMTKCDMKGRVKKYHFTSDVLLNRPLDERNSMSWLRLTETHSLFLFFFYPFTLVLRFGKNSLIFQDIFKLIFILTILLEVLWHFVNNKSVCNLFQCINSLHSTRHDLFMLLSYQNWLSKSTKKPKKSSKALAV